MMPSEVRDWHDRGDLARSQSGSIFVRSEPGDGATVLLGFSSALTEPALSSASRAGLVNNLNFGLSWGLFPLVFSTADLSVGQIGLLFAIYPGVWGAGQLVTGSLSDQWGRNTSSPAA